MPHKQTPRKKKAAQRNRRQTRSRNAAGRWGTALARQGSEQQKKKQKTVSSFALLKELCDAFAPSGHEMSVRAIVQKHIKPFVDEVYIDKLGNLFAHKKGRGEKVMLAAHLDEIAVMVKSIDPDGALRISPVGGIEVVSLIGNRVSILDTKCKGICNGVITFEELHEATEITAMPGMEDLYIDTGLNADEVRKKGITIGSYAIPRGGLITLGGEDIVCGKALDNRIGCFILIELAHRLAKTDQDIHYVFTVQEEIGLYGAKTSLYRTNPDWGIAVDVTNAEDSFDKRLAVGGGPVVLIKDAEIITNACIDGWLRDIAKKKRIPLQSQVDEYGTTDAARIMMHKEGVPTSVVSVAVRNLHSTVGIASFKDINHAVDLLYHLLKNPPKVCIV